MLLSYAIESFPEPRPEFFEEMVSFGLFQRCVYGIRILDIIETSYFYSHVSFELFGKKPLVSHNMHPQLRCGFRL